MGFGAKVGDNMWGWIRLGVMGFLALTVVYICLSWYSKSVRREKLEIEYDAGGIDGERAAFIQQGLKEYEGSLRRKLIYGVYVVPTVLLVVVIYVVNFL
jgi:Ca2+/Na+ antiporter